MEGNEEKGQANGRNLRCYDCDSKYHLAGIEKCPKKAESLWAFASFAQSEEPFSFYISDDLS